MSHGPANHRTGPNNPRTYQKTVYTTEAKQNTEYHRTETMTNDTNRVNRLPRHRHERTIVLLMTTAVWQESIHTPEGIKENPTYIRRSPSVQQRQRTPEEVG